MVVPFIPGSTSSGDRFASTFRHRVKARSTNLGATRSRLIQVLRHLGLYGEKVAARLRHEREMAQTLEMERMTRLREEREAARQHEISRAARLDKEERSARLAEDRRAARLLKEGMAYESMSEEQQAARRLEDEIASWLTSGEAGA
jgi:hypothetical protein